MLETIRYLAGLKIDGIKLQLLHVLKGTDLDRLYRQGAFQVLELSQYLELVGDCLKLLPPETVIHRLTGRRAQISADGPLMERKQTSGAEFHGQVSKRK